MFCYVTYVTYVAFSENVAFYAFYAPHFARWMKYPEPTKLHHRRRRIPEGIWSNQKINPTDWMGWNMLKLINLIFCNGKWSIEIKNMVIFHGYVK